jgi:hypothetical protein
VRLVAVTCTTVYCRSAIPVNTDTGYQLDQYLFRNDVITTSGRLTFGIDIERYNTPSIA